MEWGRWSYRRKLFIFVSLRSLMLPCPKHVNFYNKRLLNEWVSNSGFWVGSNYILSGGKIPQKAKILPTWPVKSKADVFTEHLLCARHCVEGTLIIEVIKDMALASRPRELSLFCLILSLLLVMALLEATRIPGSHSFSFQYTQLKVSLHFQVFIQTDTGWEVMAGMVPIQLDGHSSPNEESRNVCPACELIFFQNK